MSGTKPRVSLAGASKGLGQRLGLLIPRLSTGGQPHPTGPRGHSRLCIDPGSAVRKAGAFPAVPSTLSPAVAPEHCGVPFPDPGKGSTRQRAGKGEEKGRGVKRVCRGHTPSGSPAPTLLKTLGFSPLPRPPRSPGTCSGPSECTLHPAAEPSQNGAAKSCAWEGASGPSPVLRGHLLPASPTRPPAAVPGSCSRDVPNKN